jgi:nitrogen fixation-related uncharacterized protein
MRKGQTEIIGLVVIVILIVFIAIFALSFSVKPKQENEDILKLKAGALSSSLLKTNLCEGVNVKKEIENCINNNHPECLGDCSNLRPMIKDIIEKSLNEGYYFKVGSIEIGRGGCTEKVTAVNQKISNQDMEVALCRR